MLDVRQFGALVAIAAGGFINAGIDVRSATLPAAPPPAAVAASDGVPTDPVLQRAAEQALRAQLQADLQDPGASIRLEALDFQRASGRSVEGRGRAFASFDGGAPVPLEVTIAFDLPTQRVEQASYLLSGAAAPAQALGAAMRARIADRIGARLVLEFAGQPVDFALSRVEHLAAGRERLLVAGEGVASFGAEGDARTRFLATADRRTGKLITLQYELGEQIAQ
jgi:hypothetical protein